MEEQKNIKKYNLALLGDVAVGKTCIFNKFFINFNYLLFIIIN